MNRIEKFEVSGREFKIFDGTGSVDYKDVYGEVMSRYTGEILKFNYSNKNSAILLDEALKSLEIVHLIYKSIELKRPVKMSELGEELNTLGYKQKLKISQSSIRDVKFGSNVHVIEPCNLYECEIDDYVSIGPFCEIQRCKVGKGQKYNLILLYVH